MLTPFARSTSRRLLIALTAALVAPSAAAATPSALYALSTTAKSVSAYQVGSGGALSPVAGQTLTATPRDLAVSGDGQSVFAAYAGTGPTSGGVYVLPVQSDGGLAAATQVPAGSSPATSVAVSPDGLYVYLGDESGQVWAYANGGEALTSLGPPVAIPGGGRVEDLAINPDGGHLYASDSVHNEIQTFAIGADGRLGAPVATGAAGLAGPASLSITPSPRRLLVGTKGSTTGYAFDLQADGTVGAWVTLPYSSAAAGGGPVAASPVGTTSFVTDRAAGLVEVFTNDAAGITATTIVDMSGDAAGLAVTADGRTLYVRDAATDTIRQFTVDPDGLTTEVGTGVAAPPTDAANGALVLSPWQGPVADFRWLWLGSGHIDVDAGPSTSAQGSIVRYAWDWGNGTFESNGGLNPSTFYGHPGEYKITLRVYDNIGCAGPETRTYTGSTVSCNGGPQYARSETVTVPQPREYAQQPPVTVPDTPSAPPARPPAAPPVTPRLDGAGGGKARATRSGRVTLPALTATCPAGVGTCDHATVALDATIGKRRITLGKGTFVVAEGASSPITVKLSRHGRRVLARARSLEAHASVLLRSSGSARETRRTTTVRVLAPRRR